MGGSLFFCGGIGRGEALRAEIDSRFGSSKLKDKLTPTNLLLDTRNRTSVNWRQIWAYLLGGALKNGILVSNLATALCPAPISHPTRRLEHSVLTAPLLLLLRASATRPFPLRTRSRRRSGYRSPSQHCTIGRWLLVGSIQVIEARE